MFYAKSTGGFYSADIHGEGIPADAVEISGAEHAALLEGQAQGKCIVADVSGRPVLAERAPAVPDEKALARRYLSETGWYVERFAETGKPIPEEVRALRQAAREVLSS